jgi:hypothetical protein
MAQRAQFSMSLACKSALFILIVARSLGESNLAYAAANIVSQVESVMNPVKASDTILAVPTSGR